MGGRGSGGRNDLGSGPASPFYKHGEIQHINGRRIASPEYRSWQMMKNRCLNIHAMDYAYYGGRGITIDTSWMLFENFLADMGRRPSIEHTLDRIDNDGPYNESNCRWATKLEQVHNRRYK